MLSEFSTENYLTDTHENSSTISRPKCKKICICCLGLCSLVGSWSLFFVLGYNYDQFKDEI